MVLKVLNAHDIKKPSPFYFSLIIGEHLVHNYMVENGASNTDMPKVIAKKLGLQYEPTERSVLQLDGTTTNTVGIIKNLEVTLHAFPNVSIL